MVQMYSCRHPAYHLSNLKPLIKGAVREFMWSNYLRAPFNKILQEDPPSLDIPTELFLPHVIGKPVQKHAAETGMLRPVRRVLRSFLWLTTWSTMFRVGTAEHLHLSTHDQSRMGQTFLFQSREEDSIPLATYGCRIKSAEPFQSSASSSGVSPCIDVLQTAKVRKTQSSSAAWRVFRTTGLLTPGSMASSLLSYSRLLETSHVKSAMLRCCP